MNSLFLFSNRTSQFQGQYRFHIAPRNLPRREPQGWNGSGYSENSIQRGSQHKMTTFGNNESSYKYENDHAEKNATLLIAAKKQAYCDTNPFNKNYGGTPVSPHILVKPNTSKPITPYKSTNSCIELMPNSTLQLNCSLTERSSKHSMRNEENEFKLKVAKQLASPTSTKTILKNKENELSLDEGQELVSDSAKKLTSLMQQCVISNFKKSDELQKIPESDFFEASFSCQDKYDDINEAVPKFALVSIYF